MFGISHSDNISFRAYRILLGLYYLIQAKPPVLREGECIAIG